MRLPFTQLTQDAYVRARTMGKLLKIPAYAGVGLAAELFAWALDVAPEHNGQVDLSGELDDQDPAGMVAAAVGWEGKPAELFKQMVRVGFIQPPGSGPARIRGLDRYAEAIKTPEERSAHAKTAADARWAKVRAEKEEAAEAARRLLAGCSTDARALPEQSGVHAPDAQTQTHKKPLGRASKSKPPPPADVDEKLTVVVDEFWDVLQGYRRDLEIARYGSRPPGLAAWFAARLAEGVTGPELANAYFLFLEDLDFRANNWPMEVFMTEAIFRVRLRKGNTGRRPTRDRLSGVALES